MTNPSPAVIRAVAAAPRHVVCRYVADADGVVPLEDLVTQVLTEQQAEMEQSLGECAARQQVITQLHHCHLPRLDEVAVLEYDPDQHVVWPGPKLPAALDLFDTMERSIEDTTS